MPTRFKRLLLLLALAAGVALFFGAGLDRSLTLQGLRQGLAGFEAWRTGHPLALAAGFFVLYVAVVACSLPGAAVMTLAGGALFGLTEGTLLVSFASSLGATLAFLVSRHLLRDWVRARFGARLRALDEGMRRDGPFYLFTLRLVPLFPFFLVNLLLGLTPMRARTFYWVSQLGMLPGTLVYVNAGTRLAAIESPADILSPTLWLSFLLLGLFPWLARWASRMLSRRRRYARWARPRRFDRNLVVIGGGAAGLVTAYVAAAVKARVTLVEAGRLGGDCLNQGCVPSKALIASARAAQRQREAGRYGLRTGPVDVDFPAVMARVRAVIAAIEPHDSAERYAGLGVEVLAGHARLLDPWTVEIESAEGERQRLTTRSVVIATGARPVLPALPGLGQVDHFTSETLWADLSRLDAPPARLLVLGGGPVGCELAQALARLGSRVTLVEQAARLLGREDEEAAALVRSALEREGVRVLTGHSPLRCERAGETQTLVVRGAEEVSLEFDALLLALGREARLTGFGLEGLGIPTEGRTLETNEYLETLHPNVFAAGDVTGPWQLTHAAAHQGWHAAVNALFGTVRRFRVDYSALPRTVFTEPEVASVGLTEQAARERGVAFELTRFDLAGLDRAIADGATEGFVKVLTVPGGDRLLGATVVGEQAGELLAEFTLALRHGLGLNKILATVHAYPTRVEANKYAAGQWRRAHAPARLLALLERWHAWRRG